MSEAQYLERPNEFLIPNKIDVIKSFQEKEEEYEVSFDPKSMHISSTTSNGN